MDDRSAELRRRFLFHAAVQLVLALALGIPAGVGAPHARQWLAGHLGGLLNAVLLFTIGGFWPLLRLGRGGQRALFVFGALAGYFGLALGSFVAIVGLSSPILIPGPPNEGWPAAVLGIGIGVLVISNFATGGLLVAGLRRRVDPPS